MKRLLILPLLASSIFAWDCSHMVPSKGLNNIANCSQSECTDMITEEIQDKAIRANLPISMSDFKDTCKDYREVPDTISISDMLLINEEETWLIPH